MNPLVAMCVYIGLLHLGPILNLFSLLPGGRVFPITTLAHVLAIWLTLQYFRSRQKSTPLQLLVIAYLVVGLASVVLYFQTNNPTDPEAYFYGVHVMALPIFGYFAIKNLSA